MAFSTGFGYVQQALDESKRKSEAASSGGVQNRGLQYFNWKDGDKKVLRFLTDDVITEKFADFITNNVGGTTTFLIDPTDPNRLERYRSATPGIGWKQDFKTKQLVDPTPRILSVGVAVLREEVPGPNGKTVLQDYIYDRTVTDKDGHDSTHPSRFFGVVMQSVPNFWHTLAVSCFKRFGTICDRDYEITREGTGFDTKYSIIPLPEDPELTDPEVVRQFYFYGNEFDNNDPDRFLKCPQTLQQWAEYFSGEERHKFWLSPKDGSAPTGGTGEFASATTSNPADEAQSVTGTSFSSLKQTLLKNAKSA